MKRIEQNRTEQNTMQCNAMQCNAMQYNTIQFVKSNYSQLLFLFVLVVEDNVGLFVELVVMTLSCFSFSEMKEKNAMKYIKQ